MSGPGKKILVVISSLKRGGAERVVSRLTQEWDARGHAVTVAVFNAAEPAYSCGGARVNLDAFNEGGPLRKLSAAVRRVVRLRRLLAETDPDFVFGFMESANLPLAAAALFSPWRRRLTVSVHIDPARMPWYHRLGAALLYPGAGRVVAVSRGVGDRLLAGLPWRPRARVIYNPVSLEEIERNLEEPFPHAGRFFFSAGRLAPQKDFGRMLRLFAALPDPEPRLFLAGDGPERGALEALVLRLGLKERVVFLGNVENPFVYMRHAVAFLMTSRYEGFPMVLLEAFACGCPVVSVDCDFGPREAVREGRDGFIVPLRDDGAFAERVSRLAQDADLRARLSASARERARDFDVREIAAQWLNEPPGRNA